MRWRYRVFVVLGWRFYCFWVGFGFFVVGGGSELRFWIYSCGYFIVFRFIGYMVLGGKMCFG